MNNAQEEIRPNYKAICNSCGPIIICGLCGTNACNGSYGQIDGKDCPQCPHIKLNISEEDLELLDLEPGLTQEQYDEQKKKWEFSILCLEIRRLFNTEGFERVAKAYQIEAEEWTKTS